MKLGREKKYENVRIEERNSLVVASSKAKYRAGSN